MDLSSYFRLSFLSLALGPSLAFGAAYVWPISGTTTPDPMHTSYGPRMDTSAWHFHDGMDLPAAQGTTVVAIADGQIFLAGPAGTDSYSSRHVVLKTIDVSGDTLYACYMHLDWLQAGLFVGQIVSQGQALAGVGHDDASYDHLHFEIRRNSPLGVANLHPLHYLPYTDTANFVSPYAATFNVMGGAMAARLVFSAPDRNEGDLATVAVDIRQGGSVLQTRTVNFDDRATLQQGAGDALEWTNDIAVEGYQWSNMTLQGWNDLQYGVLVRKLPPLADNLVARVVDIGGNTATSGSFAIPAQTAVSIYDDYNAGTWDAGWTAFNSASGSGTSVTAAIAAALEGAQGLQCQDLSNSELGPQLATLQRSIPGGRFEWVAQADVDPVLLNLGGVFQDAFPLSIFNSTGLAAAAIIRDNGSFYEAGLLMRKPDNSYTGVLSGITVTVGSPSRWTWHLSRLATRHSVAVLQLNGIEVARWFWDSLAQPVEDLRMGLGFSSAGARVTLHEDATWFKEDTAAFFAGTPTPTLSPTPSQSPTPTPTHSPTASSSSSATLTVSSTATPSPLLSGTETPSLTATPSPSPTWTASPTATPGSPSTAVVPPRAEVRRILRAAAVPNPLDPSRGSLGIALELDGAADQIELKLYSPAGSLLADLKVSGSFRSGWNTAAFSMPTDLANGLYFFVPHVSRSGSTPVKGAPGKFFVAR